MTDLNHIDSNIIKNLYLRIRADEAYRAQPEDYRENIQKKYREGF